MNKGALRALTRGSRARSLVYVPFASYISIKEGESHTADLNTTYTPAILDLDDHVAPGRNLPPGGTLRALELMMWARNDTSNSAMALYVHDFDCPLAIGAAEGGCHFGAYGGVDIGNYKNMRATIRTGGKGNTQFKYGVQWAAGTAVIYIRALGAWYEAP
jgi:hypothetical protein